MFRFLAVFFILLFQQNVFAQSYTSYFIGDTADITSNPKGGTCLMGGATENDSAMVWFLKQANGGDVLVLRATGTNAYNSYFYTSLGVPVNSVETIVINSIIAANDPYVEKQIRNAEALWIAGGDQHDYTTYWKNTPVASALNYLIATKKAVIGGTSAGMAIMGQAYFDAAGGSVTSATTLANPYNAQVSLGYNDFIQNPILTNTITDTHYDNPDRRARHTVFLARLMHDLLIIPKGIASEEYTAVCIDSVGIARVYGDYPTYDDKAFFIQPNCILPNEPETCVSGTPLNWNRNSNALKVYKVYGTPNGSNTFNLNDWQTGSGGIWENWYVNNGAFMAVAGTIISCPTAIEALPIQPKIKLFPNPCKDFIRINTRENFSSYSISDMFGRVITKDSFFRNYLIPVGMLSPAIYFLTLSSNEKTITTKFCKQ